MTVQVAVCGPRYCTAEDEQNAHRVGQLLAERGATVICGGGCLSTHPTPAGRA